MFYSTYTIHQGNTDDGGQAMVKSWGMYRWAVEASA